MFVVYGVTKIRYIFVKISEVYVYLRNPCLPTWKVWLILAMVAVIPTSPYHGYSVLFSPFSPGRIAFVGGLNYGIAGTGALIIFDHSPQGFKELQRYIITTGTFLQLDIT